MFDNITDEERLNNSKTDFVFTEGRKKKYAHQQVQSEREDSNGSHANETDIIEALNSTSTGDSKFNSLWVVPITIVTFVVVILLTNRCLGL